MRTASRHQLAAIDLDHLAGDVAAERVGGEEEDGADAFLGGGEAAHRDGLARGLELGCGAVALVERGQDDAGRQRVDADVVLGVLLGEAVGQRRDEALGGGIDAGAGTAAVARGDRRDVDDVALAQAAEMRHRGGGGGDQRADVEVEDATGRRRTMRPALLTGPRGRRQRRATPSTGRRAVAGLLTSPWNSTAAPPAASMSATTFSAAALLWL